MLPWRNFDFGPFIIETVIRILVCHTTKLIIGIPMIHYVVILVPIGGNFPHLATTAPHLLLLIVALARSVNALNVKPYHAVFTILYWPVSMQ